MKKTSFTLRLKILATKATPKPPIGPILGQYSINLMEFCKEFNERSSQIYKPNRGSRGIIVPTIVKIREDKSYSIELKPISVSGMLELLGQGKLSASGGHNDRAPRRKKIIDARIIYEIAIIRIARFAVEAKGQTLSPLPNDRSIGNFVSSQRPSHIFNECLMIKGTIKSMGYKIIGPKDL
jgi:large subunit ribosomal protein L11